MLLHIDAEFGDIWEQIIRYQRREDTEEVWVTRTDGYMYELDQPYWNIYTDDLGTIVARSTGYADV